MMTFLFTFLTLTLAFAQQQQQHDLPPVNILIPMAGLGSRFSNDEKYAGGPPKPLIRLPDDRTLIEVAISDLTPKRYSPTYVFVVRPETRQEYDLPTLLSNVLLKNGVDPSNMIIIDATEDDKTTTDGPAVTALRASSLLLSHKTTNQSPPLLIANCDQHIVWGEGKTVDDFIDCVSPEGKTIGCLATYTSPPDESKSYVKVDDNGWAVEVAEKRVISSDASTGLYLFKTGIAFINAANAMISTGPTSPLMVNNEWYIAPAYHYLLDYGVRKFDVAEFWNTGTPQSLEHFIKSKGIVKKPWNEL